MYKGKKIGVVVPAYNEERFIAAVIRTMPEFVDRMYVVNDASTDGTKQAAAGVVGLNGRLNLIDHDLNRGVGAAIVTGYRRCLADGMDVVAVMAGDGQMAPSKLPNLLDPIVGDEADYVVGNRTSSRANMKGMTYWRRLGNWLLRWLTRIAAGNLSICDPQNGYTAISRRALTGLDLNRVYPRYGYCNDLLVKLSAAKARITQVSMPALYGEEKSKIRYHKYIPKVSWLLLKDFAWRLTARRYEVELD